MINVVGEGLTAMTTEWLAIANLSSILSTDGNITVYNNDTAGLFNRLSQWANNQYLELSDLDFSTDQTALDQWLQGRSIFLRHWSTTMNFIARKAEFEWGIHPIVTENSTIKVGTFNGWSVGIYKYSQNPAAAMKTLKWMTSIEVEKRMSFEAPERSIPTYPDLFAGTTQVYD